jgi:hypothetical protein
MTTLCFIDTETTGLDPRIHQPYEVAWWLEDESEPRSSWLAHDLTYADRKALEIGGYWDRKAWAAQNGGWMFTESPRTLALVLEGVTLVGSNPAFDAAMLTRYIGAPVWHHRLIDVANAGMWVFGLSEPPGLASVANLCRDEGYEVPEPDHTAEGDVRTTRAVYEALRAIRGAA